ncbi:hypothetical protein HYH03_007898 [Edaphochlamys debaryana]|uniref:Uncharacterized protein n=1 Tax=Edaphochlamys debaryana TaxID=47281 RepID=A0A835Y7R7_9CHLO|nr:hypothetical protein HYH03_007898 [Edaphochlamys debaryana]|eukprot:KAG2493970.1 hypothetical protein HYH03_007898 [Edaphochlamys debaryana]
MAEPREVPAAAPPPGAEDPQADLLEAVCRCDDHGQAAFTGALASWDVAGCRLACRALRAAPGAPAGEVVSRAATAAAQWQERLVQLSRLAERWPRCRRLDLDLEALSAAGAPLQSVTCLRLTAAAYTLSPRRYVSDSDEWNSSFDDDYGGDDFGTRAGDPALLSAVGASALVTLFPSLETLELGRGVGMCPEDRPAVFGALTGLRRLSMSAHLYDDAGVQALTQLTSLALLKLTLEDEDRAFRDEQDELDEHGLLPLLMGLVGPGGAARPPPPAPLIKGLAALPQLRALELEGSRLVPGCPTPQELLDILPRSLRLTLRHCPIKVPRLIAASGPSQGLAWAYDTPVVPRSRAHTQEPDLQLDTGAGSLRLCGCVSGLVALAEVVRAFEDALGGQLSIDRYAQRLAGGVSALPAHAAAAIAYLASLCGPGGGGGEGSRGGPVTRLRVRSATAGFHAGALLVHYLRQVRCPPERLLVHGHGHDDDYGLVGLLQSLAEQLPPEALPPHLRVSGYLRSDLSAVLAAWPPLQALVVMPRLEKRPAQDSRGWGGPRGRRRQFYYGYAEAPLVDLAVQYAGLLRQAAARLAPGGWCAVRCKTRHGKAALKLAQEAAEAETGAGAPRCVALVADWLCGADDEAALRAACAEVQAPAEGSSAEAD